MHSSSRIGLTTLFIIGSLLLASFPPCASASDVTFFSKTYIRKTQKPQVFTDTFTCSQPGSNISLVAKNGRNGSFRVSSALIWINGKQILRVSDFNKQVDSLTRSVVLKANNEIKVELRGKPGDFITITITGIDTNTPPVANAGPDQTAFVSKTVTLDGSKSSDVDGDALTFLWSFISVPGGSTASLSNPNAVMPAFVVDRAGTYVIQLIVSDGTVSSTPDTVTITTSNSGPVANAGPDQTAFVSQTVTLDGSKSSDVDGDVLTLLWSFLLVPSGSAAVLSNPAAVNPTFKVDLPGTYEVRLVVNDGNADSEPDIAVITTVNSKPVADAGPDQTVFVTQTVTLDGSKSSDADGNALTYKWSFSSNPTGSTAVISDPSAVKPTFTVDKPGTYVVQLIVNDWTVDSTPDSMTITTLNSKPVANAGLNQTVQVGDTATLDGSKSTDVDGDLLTYTWSFVSLPAGSSATLSDPISVRPYFTVDKPGSYVVQLIVKDGVTDSHPATVSITTENSPPVADAGPDQTVYVTNTVQLDGSKSKDADGDPLTYGWSFTSTPAGSTATIMSPADANPTFVVDRPGTYVIQLIVDDGQAVSAPATVTISTLNSKPVADAGSDQSDVIAGMSVDLNGSASSDADKDPLSYEWSFSSRPDGSAAFLSDSAIVNPNFIADLAGIYVAQLIVNDGTVDSAPDTIAITASSRMVSVPNVVGIAQAAAESAITAAGLTVGTITSANSNVVPEGHVISQDPAAGASVAQGSAVALGVSLGPVMVVVPDVVGMTQTAAGSELTSAGLTVGAITTANSSVVPAGQVISQDPIAGISVPQGSAVALWISLGPAGLPPDPVTVAPPIDPSVATTVARETEFLYTGADPIQTGVVAGIIDSERVAVLRGKVLGPNSQLLPGVTITILAHPEYGQTHSRVDGLFDLAVNGGEPITVNYAKPGYLSAQRQVSVPLQDFAWLPEVVLVSRDTRVTTVDLTASVPIQVVQGSIVTDQDGQRQASLLIPQGTTAEIVLPDGNTQPLTDLNIRITEFSVGPDGPKSMPAQLPPNVGYTYCVDLSVDQANALGAKKVSFSQPIFHYVENFLNFPVGMIVPSAYYDMERGSWVPSKNGRVIKVLSLQGNLAELDTDGDGTADNGISLGITIDEREKLGVLYSSGQSLWRVPVTHFSPWDYNWPSAYPESSRPPLQEAASSGAPIGTSPLSANPITGWGSIDPIDQIFRETLNIAGTPFTLNYSSDRAPGWKASDTLHIPVLGSNVPSGLKYVELEIYVAGRKFIETLPALSDQAYDFTWDGKDAYGRDLTNGSQEVTIIIGYAYDASYLVPSNSDPSFGQSSGVSIPGIQSRGDVSIWRLAQKATISRWDARSQGLDGWSLSEHHAYDPVGQILYLGDGRRRTAQSAGPVITTVAGTGKYLCERGDLVPGKWWCENQENIPATETPVQYPGHVLVKPDGSFFTTDTWFFGLGYEGRVRNVDENGAISTVAGSWYCTPDGTNTADGIPATQACIDPQSLALGPDGNLYIATGQRIRKVGADGLITTVAGRYPQSYGGIADGIPAIEADMRPRGIAFGPDRSLYFADWMYGVVRRIDPDGVITTVAGNGQSCWDWVCGDGGPATSAALGSPEYIAIASDGSIYFTDRGGNPALRKVGPDGIITTVLLGWEGYEQQLGRNWDDGVPTASALAGDLREIAFGPDGSLYVNTSGDRFGNGNPHAFIRKIDTRGIVTTVAGTFPRGDGGDGGPPAQAQFSLPEGIYISPDGSIYLADTGNSRVRRIAQSLPGTGLTSFSIPSEDATMLYDFDASGRHVATRHALTGAPLYQFYYDQLGYLSQVMDGNGNATVIERALGGAPAAILSPYGQRTAMASDENGYLESFVNPASETTRLSYAEGGLLATVTNPKGDPYKFTYDNKGRLIKAEDPSNGSNTLSRTHFGNGYEVTLTSAMNRVTTYKLERLSSGGQHKITTLPDGTRNEALWASDGSISGTSSSGLTTGLVQGPDPRFKVMSPLPIFRTMATPGNLIYNAAIGREVYLTDTKDIFSLFNQTDTLTINGRAYISSYDAPKKTFTDITPEGRQSTSTIDNLGRVTRKQVAGLLPRSYSYDSRGRVSTVTLGSGVDARITSFAYNAGNGYLETITDPMGRSVRFESDAVGRVTKKTLPDGKDILYGYDANGNQTSITPPGKPEHSFTYTPVDLLSKYIAPSVAAENSTTELFSNPDRQPSGVLWPDGQSMDLNYDSAGRMGAIMPGNQRGYAYDSVTGRLTSITSPDQLLGFSYDGNLLTSESWTGTIAGTVSRTYDNNFRIASISINGGNTIAFTRDNDNLFIQAGDLNLTRSSQNGLITGTTLGNVTDSRSYNGFGEIDAYSVAYSGGEFYSVHYTRDKLGRTTRKEETSGGTTSTHDYVYDLAGRLTEVKQNGATSAQYTYDDNGNRLSAAVAGNTISGIYDAQDRLTQYGSTTYTYSGKGELLSKTEGGQITAYQYDSLGNLTSVTLPGSTRIDYAIDGSNRRIGKRVNGNQVQGFLYNDLLKPVAELDGDGNVVAFFVYGSKTNVPDYVVKSGNTYRIISDALGSPRIVMDVATGAIAQRMDYDEFGNVMKDTSPGFQPFGFAGGLYDPDTGLVQFGAREYDSELGRWISKDPIGFAGMDTNLYAYVQNDPVNFTDRSGLSGGQGTDHVTVYHVNGNTYYIPDSLIPYLQAEQHEINLQLFYAQSGYWSPSSSGTEGYPPGSPQYLENLQQLYNQQIFYDQMFPIPITTLPVSEPIAIQPMPGTSMNPGIPTPTGMIYQ